ncbi:MAG: homoserine O-succinyltransferase [Bacillota bacterium]|nr:MAG: homoserine O-succinyltransferase [Bacillota bacterium]
MPIVIPKEIPAYKTLVDEKIFVMTAERAAKQDIRPIEIAIVNLMPTKIVTETQLMRLLSNSPLQINVTLVSTETYTGKHTPIEHLNRFYKPFGEVKNRRFDGLIVTGAPVETMEFEEVKYWPELEEIFEFARNNVTSTIFICWGAQAALYYYYGIEKRLLDKKLFGVFKHKRLVQYERLLKGMDDEFYMPHSRHTTIDEEQIRSVKELQLLASSKEAGASIIKSKNEKFFFITGHAEYDRETLQSEYERDLARGLETVTEPVNYYVNGYKNGKGKINMSWASTANLIYVNWLNYYVYQITPFKLYEE